MTPADHSGPTTVEAYLASFPTEVREVLEQVRAAILRAVPGAGERISYQIPTITVDDRPLLYFAGWKRHVSLYPVPDGDTAFEDAVAPYRSDRSTLKFPLSKPVPYDLVERVAAAHLEQRASDRA